MDHYAAALEREVQFYRAECNELGARLLRMQEEQSLAHREARRSKTVAKLVREAYRLGDMSRWSQDLGMPVLELIVDHVLCDRAALLREEPVGSGQFLISHAVGLAEDAMHAIVRIAAPSSFTYTTEHEPVREPADQIVAALGVPYILWAYDRSSGLALVVGNRIETNVNRPFERSDETLIEGALSVYADLLYRKHLESQLHQARQTAGTIIAARANVFQDWSDEMDKGVRLVEDAFLRLAFQLKTIDAAEHVQSEIEDIKGSLTRLNQTICQIQAAEGPPQTALAYEWVCIDDIVRAAMRPSYALNIRRGVEVDCSLPRRRIAICADRLQIQQVIQNLIELASEWSISVGTIRVIVSRRSDGGLDLIIAGGQTLPSRNSLHLDGSFEKTVARRVATRLDAARATIEEHGGTLTLQSGSGAGVFAHAVFPPTSTRDIELTIT